MQCDTLTAITKRERDTLLTIIHSFFCCKSKIRITPPNPPPCGVQINSLVLVVCVLLLLILHAKSGGSGTRTVHTSCAVGTYMNIFTVPINLMILALSNAPKSCQQATNRSAIGIARMDVTSTTAGRLLG
ncbi:hypothetical protein V8F06_001343 [Rhypophila decipiens]